MTGVGLAGGLDGIGEVGTLNVSGSRRSSFRKIGGVGDRSISENKDRFGN